MPGITENDLRNAGFTDFKEESGVYRVIDELRLHS